MTEPEKKAKVQINYKSGISMVVECDELTIRGTHHKTYEWSGMVPNPLHFGAADIESVWEIAE